MAQAPIEGLVEQATHAVLASLTAGGVTATFGPPTDETTRGALTVWPLDLLPEHVGVPGPDLLRLRVRILVAPDTSTDSLAALDRALVVAARAPHLVLAHSPLSTAVWTALGVRPRAAVVVEVPVRVPRPTEPVVRVRGPLRVDMASTGKLYGRVLGPRDVPVSDALVEAAGLDASVRTGRDGGFALVGVPAAGPVRLVVSARGVSRTTQIAAGGAEPIVLRIDFEEV